MTLFNDYKTGSKIGVHLDESVCSSSQRKNYLRRRAEFFYELEDTPFFSDKAPHLANLANEKGIFIPMAHYTAIDKDAGTGEQLDSDCFSWSTRGMIDTNRIAEWLYQDKPKQYIESSATCLIYGSRGHCSQGMTVYDVIRGFDKGILLEIVYELNHTSGRIRYDFRSYPEYYRLGVSNWCKNGPPESLVKETRKYSLPDYAIATSMEEIDANLVAGRTWSCGSSIGVSSVRDENGVSGLKGSWAHAMHIFGLIRTDWALQKYGEELYCWDNSWGNWNRGPDPQWAKDLGIKLPEGFFLLTRSATWQAVRAKQTVTCSNIRGFPDLKLRNLGFEGRI